MLIVLVSGCAAPVFKDTKNVTVVSPYEVQANPSRFQGVEVLWAGKVAHTKNFADSTEIELIAYPIDRTQQPIPEAPTAGRFIIVLPEYAEAQEYPYGRYLTVQGCITATREGQVDEHEYVFPLVSAYAIHLWPLGFQFDKPQVRMNAGATAIIR